MVVMELVEVAVEAEVAEVGLEAEAEVEAEVGVEAVGELQQRSLILFAPN